MHGWTPQITAGHLGVTAGNGLVRFFEAQLIIRGRNERKDRRDNTCQQLTRPMLAIIHGQQLFLPPPPLFLHDTPTLGRASPSVVGSGLSAVAKCSKAKGQKGNEGHSRVRLLSPSLSVFCRAFFPPQNRWHYTKRSLFIVHTLSTYTCAYTQKHTPLFRVVNGVVLVDTGPIVHCA